MPDASLPTAAQLLALAQEPLVDPVVAYLIGWAALRHVVQVLGERAGVRPQFSLRQNGTLRVRKIGGLKMPEVIPPSDEHLFGAALGCVSPEACERLITHAAVRYLAGRTPKLGGQRLARDAYKQQPRGVLDVGATLDPRYPVWAFVDADLLRRYMGGEKTAETGQRLLAQIVEVLATIHRNLQGAACPESGEANADLAGHALPLLVALVETLAAVVAPVAS